jgi:fibronectin type 3 domain-containing protein
MKTIPSNFSVNRTWLLRLGVALLSSIGLAFFVSNAKATLIAYDPMNYTGSQLNTTTAAPSGTPDQSTGVGGGFTGNWSGGALTLNSFGDAYPSLPVAGKSISALGANNLYTHIAGAPSSGSVWVSFLFKQNSDNGGNRSGVFLENSSGVGVMLSYQQFGSTQGEPCLMAMSGTTTVGTQLKTSSTVQTYANTNLYVLQFTYTAGVVSSISVYSNPTAGQGTAPAADFTVSSGLPSFGSLVNFGLADGSAMGITLDEFRVGTTFGDVVGVSLVPVNVSITSPTNNQTVSIYNFNVSANASVVPGSIANVAFYLDSTLVTNLTAAPYTYTASGVSAGAHTLYAVATDSGSNTATSAIINITAADLPPTVTLTNPIAGNQFLTGSSVTLGASATDDDSVTNVGFYVDGALVGNATNSPFSAMWVATSGAHALAAVATDSAGQSTTSAVVNVTGTLPMVSIASPTNDQAVSIYSFNVTANATVSPGSITNVDFYLDTVLFASKTNSPYAVTVSGASAGAHELQAVAMDSDGNSVTSAVINVTAADLPPSVTLTNPANNSLFLGGSTVTLGASAADDSAVTNVSFYVDGQSIGNAITNPYTVVWIATPGAHMLTAVATDNAGQSTTSAVVNVTGTLPSVSITTPTNNQSVSIYNFNVTATASVSPGTVTNVSLYLDSTLVTNQTSLPYTFVVSGASAGAHTLDAVAMDSNGNSVTSAIVNVTAADLPPTVTLTNPATGGALLIGSTVTLGAAAADDHSVTNVAFYADGALVANSTTNPYSAAWNVASLGAHSLTAVASDDIGQTTTSAVVNVTGVLNFNAYEPFNYATGALTNGTPSTGTGFKGNWVCGASGTIVGGLSYANLPTSNQALQNNASYQIERLAGTTSSGIVWVSVIFQQAGDNGGNRSGFLMEDSTGKGLMFAYTQASGSQGFPSLVNVSATNTVGSTLSTKSATLRTYNTPNLYVFRLTYNVSGALTNVAVYSDPTAGQSTAPTADFTVTGLTGIGAISTFGVDSPSGEAITIDEIRTGSTFASVVGVPLPSAPIGLTATPGSGQVVLTWTAPATGNPTGYNVKRSTVSGLETNFDTTTTTNYTDLTALNGVTYYYEVSGTNSAGEGFYSNEASAAPASAPGQVQGLAAVAGVNSVSLTWDATSGAIGYLVLRGTTSGVYTETNSSPTNSDFDATAAGGTTYYYVVQATNAGGVGPISAEVSAMPQTAAPSAPAQLTATPGNGQVSLSWSIGVGATGYNVKRSISSGSETTMFTTSETTFLDSTAINGNIYYYTVSSTNANGESPDSTEAVAAMPPATPTGLTATPGANQITLNWAASSGPSGASSYTIERSIVSGSGYTSIDTVTSPTVSYTDTRAISGTTYYYVVAGVNASGQGANSSEATATPSGAPQAPTALTVTTNYTSLTISWTAALGAPTGYNVKRSTTSGTEVTLLAGTGVTNTTFTDTTVAIGINYFYTVSAVNGSGEGPDSIEVAGTAPGTPLAYEPFNYSALTNGTPSTGEGFSGNWMITNGATIVDGLSYPNLFTSNSALQVASGNQYENLSIPLFSGTVYVSFLYSQSGDFGGNRGGFQLLDHNGNGLMFAYHQFGGTTGLPSVDAITGYNSVGSELGVSATPQTYAAANLYVMRLDFNTNGALTNVSFYSNPMTGQGAPAPDFTMSSGLGGIGSITTLGMRTGLPTTVDEWRVGTTFDQVVIGKSFATVTLGNLSQNFDGTAKSVTATTVPPGLTVDITYDGSSDAPTNAGTYEVIGTVVDTNYYGSVTNSLVIVNPINTTPTNLVTTVSGNQLTLTWPADHTGWTLQAQTNTLTTGVTTNWFDVDGSSTTNQVTITIDPNSPTVFYRMKY